jgi:ribosomal protein L40E
MSFFDDLKKSLEAFSKSSESMFQKSSDAVELRKLKMEQDSLKKELNNCYAQIGRMFLEKIDDDQIPAEMEMLVRQIEDCKEAMAENDQLIAKKTGQRLCPVCGAKAGKEAVFCQKCGTRLPDFAVKEEEPEPETAEPEAEEAESEPVKGAEEEKAEPVQEEAAKEDTAEDTTPEEEPV